MTCWLLLLSDTVQNAIVGPDNSQLGGPARRGRAADRQLHHHAAWFQHPALARALEGTPITLAQDGRMLDDNLRRQGGRNLHDLEAVVVLEASGALTVEADPTAPIASRSR